jgi:hypothetical protein
MKRPSLATEKPKPPKPSAHTKRTQKPQEPEKCRDCGFPVSAEEDDVLHRQHYHCAAPQLELMR